MNTENIKIDIKIPIMEFDKPDRNGVIHTREAYKNAIGEKLENTPLITYDFKGDSIPIGIGNITFEEDHLRYTGYIWSGGFSCIVDDYEKNGDIFVIKKMQITGIGFDTTINSGGIYKDE